MKTVEVCTAQYGYSGADGLDTTFATLEAVTKTNGHDEPGGWLFAPPKWLVHEFKYKGMAWDEYARVYAELLRIRYSLRAAVYERLCVSLAATAQGGHARVVLKCYCAASVIHECHRRLAADILVKIGNSVMQARGVDCLFTRGDEIQRVQVVAEPEKLLSPF